MQHPQYLNKRLDHPSRVISGRFQKLPTPNVLQDPAMLSHLLAQVMQLPDWINARQLYFRVHELDDARPVEQHEGLLDRIAAHERTRPVRVQAEVDKQVGAAFRHVKHNMMTLRRCF
jgi:hypothetical protein